MKNILLFLLAMNFSYLQAQHCWPASAQTELDINNIRAKLLNGGDMWWDGVSNGGYQFPKADTSNGQIPENLITAGALWMTALDANGDLKCAAQTYRNQGHEFWPGPLVYGQTGISDITCTNFDRFFPILRTELNAHIDRINDASETLNTATIAANILQWPGKGNLYLEETYNMPILNDLAPFQDCNENGIYDPENGDYPLMKGDQSIFWVINDLGNTHGRSGGEPLGVEIQCLAYAYIANNDVNNATFYDYKILKKTPGNLTDFYFSQFVDPDIEGYDDDYIGCDTTLNYSFAYNAVNTPTGAGSPPIAIAQFLKTPNNLGMSSFSNLKNSSGPGGPIATDGAYHKNFQTGKDGNGSLVTCGGYGVGGTVATKFLYPGNPSEGNNYTGTCTDWSECSASTTPDDRRLLMTSGPYDLNTNSPLEFTVAVMVAETDASTYTGCPDKNTVINPVVNTVNNFIATVNDKPYTCKVLNGITDFNAKANLVSIYPNPTNNYLMIKTAAGFEINTIQIFDLIGSEVKANIETNKIDVAHLNKGVYTLKINSKKLSKTLVKKFVVR